MNELILDLLGPFPLFFAPLFIWVALHFFVWFLYWQPIAMELGVSFWDRSASRRVLFRGIRGGSEALRSKVKTCRLAFMASHVGFFAFVFFMMGFEGFAYLFTFFLAAVVLSKPYDVEGGRV
jgi:hypothetical protein